MKRDYTSKHIESQTVAGWTRDTLSGSDLPGALAPAEYWTDAAFNRLCREAARLPQSRRLIDRHTTHVTGVVLQAWSAGATLGRGDEEMELRVALWRPERTVPYTGPVEGQSPATMLQDVDAVWRMPFLGIRGLEWEAVYEHEPLALSMRAIVDYHFHTDEMRVRWDVLHG